MHNFVCSCAVLLLTLSAASSSGCATVGRLLNFPESPQVYGGTRTHVYPSQKLFNSLYERDSKLDVLMEPFVATVWAIDLFCSFAADTVCLPMTIPGERFAKAEPENTVGTHDLAVAESQ